MAGKSAREIVQGTKAPSPAPAPAPAPVPKPPPAPAPAPKPPPAAKPPGARPPAPRAAPAPPPAPKDELSRAIAVVPGSAQAPVVRPTAAAGFKAGTAPGTPERAAAIRAEQERVSIQQGDLDEDRVKARKTATAETSATPFRVLAPSGISPEPFDPLIKATTAVASVEAASAPLEQKSEFLGAAQRILAEQAHLDRLEAEDKQGIVTAPALLARKRTELAAKYPQAIQLNVPLMLPRTDDEGAHPMIKAFRAASNETRIDLRQELKAAADQYQAAFDAAPEAERPQTALEFLRVALLRDAVEDEARRQRGAQ